jgi:hypothetical protein
MGWPSATVFSGLDPSDSESMATGLLMPTIATCRSGVSFADCGMGKIGSIGWFGPAPPGRRRSMRSVCGCAESQSFQGILSTVISEPKPLGSLP